MTMSNNSSTVTSSEQDRAPPRATFFIALLIIITVVSNLLFIVLFFTSRRLRTPFNIYLLNIAINDFLTGLIDMPYYAVLTYYGYWALSDLHCSVWMFFDFTVDLVSLWGLVAVSVDRVWSITWPVSYCHHNSFKKAFFLIGCGWVICYASMLPGYIYTRSHFANQSVNLSCEWINDGAPSWASSIPLAFVDIFTPVILTVICYMIVVVQMGRLKRQRQINAQNDDNSRRESRRKKKDRQALLVLTALIVACVLAWVPWWVCMFLHLVTEEEYSVCLTVTYWLSYGLSGANPFMSGIASSDVRYVLKHFCGRKPNRGRVSAISAKHTGGNGMTLHHHSSNHD
ncbi:hypothetical protein RvY_04145 [Ramazzottius varieornatus]|uniref:G-protein coupled receptors family 1 profile domain-containing protein n=1 Tax=Ramazzottius varieornatus TaxID=947166 RepID=A0A1D1UW98_RAMVA|nr:hypothetical protein RvY_04145 [Ramazzottius varieornatus]